MQSAEINRGLRGYQAKHHIIARQADSLDYTSLVLELRHQVVHSLNHNTSLSRRRIVNTDNSVCETHINTQRFGIHSVDWLLLGLKRIDHVYE